MTVEESVSLQVPVLFVTDETSDSRSIHPLESLQTKEVAASSRGQGSVRQVQSEGGGGSKEVSSSQVS